MSDTIAERIDEARDGIVTYTNDFSGDIGSRFKRVDARLERAQDALNADGDREDDVRDHLEDAKSDLRTVVNDCFTGFTPGNFEQYVEAPLDEALDSL